MYLSYNLLMVFYIGMRVYVFLAHKSAREAITDFPEACPDWAPNEDSCARYVMEEAGCVGVDDLIEEQKQIIYNVKGDDDKLASVIKDCEETYNMG